MSERKPLTDEQLDGIWKEMLKPDAKKPPRLDRSAWEPCNRCKSCWTCKSAIEPVRAENSKCFLCEYLSNYEPLNYCPHCGRPLTDAAWEMLEKRLEGARK